MGVRLDQLAPGLTALAGFEEGLELLRERLARVQTDGRDSGLAQGTIQCVQAIRVGLGVTFTKRGAMGVQFEEFSGFGVLNGEQAGFGQLAFKWIVEVDADEIVPGIGEADFLKRASGRCGRFQRIEAVQKIGDQEYQAGPVEHVVEKSQRRADLSAFVAGLVEYHFLDHAQDVAAAFAHGQEKFNLVGEKAKGGFISVACCGKGEGGPDFRGKFSFGQGAGCKGTGGGDVHGHDDAQFPFFTVFLDERAAHAVGDVPVDIADIVAGHVFAEFLEIETAPLELAEAAADHHVIDKAVGANFDASDRFKHFADVHASGHRDGVKDFLDEEIGGDALSLGFICEDDAVAENVRSNGFNILGCDVGAALQKRPSLGGEGERNGGARGGSKLDVAFEVEMVLLWGTCGKDDTDDVIADFVIDVYGVHEFAGLMNLLQFDDRFDRGIGSSKSHGIENLALLFESGIADNDLEHEAVDLSFGQWISAFLVDGVFSCQNEKRGGQGHCFATEGYLTLLHGLEQGGLDFGRGAIDFIGEDKVGEDGAFGGSVGTVLWIIDERAHNVCRQQVGGELDSVKLCVDGGGKGAHAHGLGEAGHAFEQYMPVGKQANQ